MTQSSDNFQKIAFFYAVCGGMPEIFIYDRLPETLYEYLQTTSNINEVYSATHNSATYTLDLLDYTVVYDIKTATITYSSRNSR